MATTLHRTRDERGASAVEYGLLVTGIATVVTLAVIALGGMANDLMSKPCEQVASTAATAQC